MRKPGAISSIRLMTVSPNASRFAGVQGPSCSEGGTYCTNTDMKCLPSGAIVGSIRLGMTMSR
ncbi:hypothetical protein D3C83_169540 [compost metagenome]